jgi:predicted nucleotidyltransferase
MAHEVDWFVREVKRLYQPEVFVLFGSRARGESLLGSDYDVLIVSEKFEGVSFTDRLTPLHKLWRLMESLECICLTPQEYSKSKNMISLIQKAVREGVVL